jgi:hypothetical protein
MMHMTKRKVIGLWGLPYPTTQPINMRHALLMYHLRGRLFWETDGWHLGTIRWWFYELLLIVGSVRAYIVYTHQQHIVQQSVGWSIVNIMPKFPFFKLRKKRALGQGWQKGALQNLTLAIDRSDPIDSSKWFAISSLSHLFTVPIFNHTSVGLWGKRIN